MPFALDNCEYNIIMTLIVCSKTYNIILENVRYHEIYELLK